MDNLFKDLKLRTPDTIFSEENSIYIQQLMTSVEIGKALTSTFNMDQILIIILKRLSELIKAKNWTLFLLDQKSQELYFEVVKDHSPMSEYHWERELPGPLRLQPNPYWCQRCSTIHVSVLEWTSSQVLSRIHSFAFHSRCKVQSLVLSRL